MTAAAMNKAKPPFLQEDQVNSVRLLKYGKDTTV
jgi:hypothetical protein